MNWKGFVFSMYSTAYRPDIIEDLQGWTGSVIEFRCLYSSLNSCPSFAIYSMCDLAKETKAFCILASAAAKWDKSTYINGFF